MRTCTTYFHVKKHILTNARLEFDGINRIDKVSEYFERQQINDYFKTNCKEGIYVYSFSINPKEYQPSGAMNVNRFAEVSMEYNTIEPPFNPMGALVEYICDASSNPIGFRKNTKF